MRRAEVLAVLALAATASPAPADCVAVVSLGTAHTLDALVRLRHDAAERPDDTTRAAFRGRSFESPLYYALRIECVPSERVLGASVDFVHAKAYATLPADAPLQALAMSHGLNFLTGSIVARWPRQAPAARRVAGFVRGGGGLSLPHVESTVDGQRREGYELGGPAATLGAGLEFHIGPRLLVPVEYRWSWTRVDASVANGKVNTSLNSHHVLAGVGWRFRS